LLEVTNLDTAVKKLYEGMFLIDSAEAAKDWDGIIETITKMLAKIDAEIISLRKWDERPLAYKIRKCERGTYLLSYFRAEGPRIHELERDVELSERIVRAMILNGDHLTEADIAKETPSMRAERPIPQPAATQAAVEAQAEAVATEIPAPAEEPKATE
jgi:small subunit ribosomal protein S6